MAEVLTEAQELLNEQFYTYINDDDSGSDADVNDNAEVAADELLEIEVDDDEEENSYLDCCRYIVLKVRIYKYKTT